MTKFIFSAFACVAFAFSGLASNEEVEKFESKKTSEIEGLFYEKEYVTQEFDFFDDNGDCNILILVLNKKGMIIDVIARKKSNISSRDCTSIFNGMMDLTIKEYGLTADIYGESQHTPY